MATRLPTLLPRIAVLVLVALAASTGITLAAGSAVPSAPAVPTVAVTPPAPLVVPDVRNQAFVFAKGTLGDAGFAWRVVGSVHGFAANVVAAQSPAAGTRVVDTGAPLITLTLRRNGSYPQAGAAEDVSSYAGTVVEPSDLSGNPIGPAAPAAAKPAAPARTTTTATPAAAPAATTPATTRKPAKAAATWPQNRPAAFSVPGARKEPLDEMPLPDRAAALAKWLDAHPAASASNAKYWLYQNAWVVTGAKFGWWHGVEALRTLIAVDRRAQKVWGIGADSAAVAAQALVFVQAHSK